MTRPKPKTLTDRELRDIIAEIPRGASWSPYLHALRELQALRRAMPKGATVRAWGFATRDCNGVEHVYCSMSRGNAKNALRSESWAFRGYTVGPVTRIEVAAPKERKR